jgi:hypothetical protein
MEMAVCLGTNSKRSPSSIAIGKHRKDHKDSVGIVDPAARQSLAGVPTCEAVVLPGLATTEEIRMDRDDTMAVRLGHAQVMDRSSITSLLVHRGHNQRTAHAAHTTGIRARDHGIATPNPAITIRATISDHPRDIQTPGITARWIRGNQTPT